VLYFFRTPPGVRVGRAPIDEDAIRLLEQHNPDVRFDWTQILRPPPPQASRREEHRRGPERAHGRHDRQSPHPPPRSAAEYAAAEYNGSAEPVSETEGYAEAPGNATTGGSVEPLEDERVEAFEPEPLEREPLESQLLEPSELEPMDLSEREPVELQEPEPVEPPELLEPAEPAVEPRYARLGFEGLARLRARHAEILARISEKPLDEAVREELRAKAERLNPDAWVTADEVTEALEQYERVFEELRAVVGRHRRK